VNDDEDFPMFVYHVTFARNLDSIDAQGLLPEASGALGRGGYGGHSSGRLFLTEQDGVDFWYERMEAVANDLSDDPLGEGFVPLVLRVPSYEEKMQEDEAGTEDAGAQSWFMIEPIASDEVEVWDGEQWTTIDEFDPDVCELAFDDDGYFLYQDQNPLAQPDFEAD